MTVVKFRQRNECLLKAAVLVYLVRFDRLEFFTVRRRPSVCAEMGERASLRNSSTYLGTVFEEGLLDISVNGTVRACNDLRSFVVERCAESDEFGPFGDRLWKASSHDEVNQSLSDPSLIYHSFEYLPLLRLICHYLPLLLALK